MILSKTKRAKVRKKTGNYCWYCGECLDNGKMTIDHITPLSRGGAPRSVDNMLPACQPCNEQKADMTIDEYKSHLNLNFFYGELVGWKL